MPLHTTVVVVAVMVVVVPVTVVDVPVTVVEVCVLDVVEIVVLVPVDVVLVADVVVADVVVAVVVVAVLVHTKPHMAGQCFSAYCWCSPPTKQSPVGTRVPHITGSKMPWHGFGLYVVVVVDAALTPTRMLTPTPTRT